MYLECERINYPASGPSSKGSEIYNFITFSNFTRFTVCVCDEKKLCERGERRGCMFYDGRDGVREQ